MSSRDNSQFDPQPALMPAESAEHPASAAEAGVSLDTPADSAAPAGTPSESIPVVPALVENPVWSGWDVLLMAGLVLVTSVRLPYRAGYFAR